ncbi:rhomboid family intramembrane serine protease [bacterium]|nr:rhomboid family intramembrane serine protease [bacterium]
MLFPLIDDNPTRRWPYVTVGLIVLNTLVWLAMLGLDPLEINEAFFHFGFVPQRFTAAVTGGEPVAIDLHELLADSPQAKEILDNQRKEDGTFVLSPSPVVAVLTIFTSMFLHAGIAHLIGNMWFLWIFGNNVEDRLGHVPYLLFYLLGGMCATIAHWTMTSGSGALLPTVGASGAVAVVLGAYAITYPKARVRCLLFLVVIFMTVDLPAVAVLGIWIGWQVIQGVLALHMDVQAGVAWWAHIGGFLFGMAVMALLKQLIPDTTYRAFLKQEKAFQFDAPRRGEIRY